MTLRLIVYLFAILFALAHSFPTISDTCNLKWNKTGITVLENVSTGVKDLRFPSGLYFDTKTEILYIADGGNNRILKLYPNGKVEIAAGHADGTGGSTDSTLWNPVDVVADENENLYIADWSNHRVQYWEKNAKSGRTVAGNGNPGDSLNQFRYPSRVLLDSAKNIIVVDTQNARVVKWAPISASNRSNIELMAGGNGAGYSPSQLNEPLGLIYDEAQQIFYISNHDSSSITQWYIGDYQPHYIYAGIPGRSGNTSAQLFYQESITMDKYGNLYVADCQNNRIQLFCPNAVLGQTIIGTGESGRGANELSYPGDVVLDADLNLYVSDSFNGRIQKFMRIQ